MGNSNSAPGSSIGDLFWTDNPNRRSRAQQLSNDINNLIDRFNAEKAHVETLEPQIQARMNDYLKKHGYSSLDELITHVDGVLHGGDLDKWKEMKSKLNTMHAVESWILTVSGVTAAASGLISGGLILLGLISNPIGWAILGASLAITVVTVLTLGIIEGSEERDALRDKINSFCHQRVDMQLQLAKVEALRDWMAQFDIWFQNEWMDLDPNIFEKHFGETFKAAMDSIDRGRIIQQLRDYDNSRSAWTNEDPNVDEAPQVRMFAMAPANSPEVKTDAAPAPAQVVSTTLKITGNAELEGKAMTFRLAEMVGPRDGEIVDTKTNNSWEIHAKPDLPDATVAPLSKIAFLLVDKTTGGRYEGCRLEIVSA